METGMSETTRISAMQHELQQLIELFVEQLSGTEAMKQFYTYVREQEEAMDKALSIPTPENVRILRYCQQIVQNYYGNLVRKQPEVIVVEGLVKLHKYLEKRHDEARAWSKKILGAIGPNPDEPCEGCTKGTCIECIPPEEVK